MSSAVFAPVSDRSDIRYIKNPRARTYIFSPQNRFRYWEFRLSRFLTRFLIPMKEIWLLISKKKILWRAVYF